MNALYELSTDNGEVTENFSFGFGSESDLIWSIFVSACSSKSSQIRSIRGEKFVEAELDRSLKRLFEYFLKF